MQLPNWLLKTDGKTVLRVAGVLFLIMGALDVWGVVTTYTLGLDLSSIYVSLPPFLSFATKLIEIIMPIAELTAGVLAFYYAKHQEKYGLAILTAMIMIGLGAISANLVQGFLEKIIMYIFVLLPYIYYLGALKHQGVYQREERQAYQAEIEKYRTLYEQEKAKNDASAN